MTMLEKVAMALRKERQCDPELSFPCAFCHWPPYDGHAANARPGEPADYEVGCMYLARAAIEALRHPTDEIIEAHGDAVGWHRMIDAILPEQQKSPAA